MKKLLVIVVSTSSFSLSAQTVTDSVNTSIGDFVLVTSESVQSSEVYLEEAVTTSDGGAGEFVGVSSNARFMLTPVSTSNLELGILPNPTTGTTELTVSGMSGTANIVVTDVLGQVVYSTSTTIDLQKQIFLPSQLWQSGTYLIVVSNGLENKTERLVKQ